jgi:bacteriorhodopsin
MSRLLSATMSYSIWIQVVTGAIVAAVVVGTAPPSPRRDTLWKLLSLELTVQVIEFAFYVTWIRTARVEGMSGVRYFDWFLTTPVMLFTISAYTAYTAYTAHDPAESEGRAKPFALSRFVRSEARYLAIIAAANWAMLLFGVAADTGVVSAPFAFVAGFLAMGVSFGAIWHRYARHSAEGRRIFAALSVVWSLYGVAFLADPTTKNSAYNALDVVAKNLFGLFLAYKVVKSR